MAYEMSLLGGRTFKFYMDRSENYTISNEEIVDGEPRLFISRSWWWSEDWLKDIIEIDIPPNDEEDF
jgi:hypothetical protein